jgi:hypothetical protein
MDNTKLIQLIGGPADGRYVKVRETDTIYEYTSTTGTTYIYAKRIGSGRFEFVRQTSGKVKPK